MTAFTIEFRLVQYAMHRADGTQIDPLLQELVVYLCGWLVTEFFVTQHCQDMLTLIIG
jgi:hypothetical protein